MKPEKKKRQRKSSKHATILQQLAEAPQTLAFRSFRHQCGAICFRLQGDVGAEVLLITSRDTGRWIIPKGWPIKGKTSSQAAAIEAYEEAGVRGKIGKKPVGRYTYLKSLENGDVVPCVVELYSLEVTKIDEDFKEKGQRQSAWVATDEAPRRVREVELKSFLASFKPRKKGSRLLGPTSDN